MRVLIIPEDFRNDEFMLKPIIEAMFKSIGKSAKVRVCSDPRLQGVSQALKWERIEKIISRYKGMNDVILLCIDRDGQETRKAKLENIEAQAAELLSAYNCLFLAENAWQEIEVWVLAGFDDLPKNWSWQEIRREPDPKEMYFEPYARAKGLLDGSSPGQGRKILGIEAARNYSRIRQFCPEDIGNLEDRLKAQLVNF
ncbi:hypothetical protein Pse7367_1181 [Thalassoporum mexicanum PCC 7367]|uniref:hypothetical protein n=1 Tax=Thalassoporum mexicanum TaxID=3457544 RepID=UPI00029FC9F9|nr:hypothetical protein [Pseudanabaena sp. PCC 7367]AFY69478.1 hypothetical protein Pse7367_1181 [Pseudanabaena sp. PCC 7367]